MTLKFKDFMQERRKTGVYVSAIFTPETVHNLTQWSVDNLIEKPLDPSKYHSTILYSRKTVPSAQDIVNSMSTEFEFSASNFSLFDGSTPELKCLVVELNAPELKQLHQKLKDAGGTHDFPEYNPHVTLSYNVPSNVDLSIFKLPDFKFKISFYNVEPLDLNWNET